MSGQLLIDLEVTAGTTTAQHQGACHATLQMAEAALKANPDDLNARFARATAYFRLGDNQKAIDDLNVVNRRSPQANIAPYQYRAIAHARLGKDKALAELEKFQKGDSTESSRLYLAAIVAAELGEGADKAFEKPWKPRFRNNPRMPHCAMMPPAPFPWHHSRSPGKTR